MSAPHEFLESAAMIETLQGAKDNHHMMGAWHWVNEATVQSRCIFCNAGIVVGKNGSGSKAFIGIGFPCLKPIGDKQNLIYADSSGGTVTYD